MKTIYTKLLPCAFLAISLSPISKMSAEPSVGFAATVQQTIEDHNIKVIFIDHEPSLRVNDVITQLREIRTQALENDHAVIFYMPNNQEPYISMVNVGDKDDARTSDDAFGDLCYALNQPSHNKDAYFDRKRFVDLFSEFNIIQSDGKIGFRNVRVEFWLTDEFWQLGYNESIVAPIYFALDVPKLIEQEFVFDAYLEIQTLKKIDQKHPFGLKNLSQINKMGVNEYYF